MRRKTSRKINRAAYAALYVMANGGTPADAASSAGISEEGATRALAIMAAPGEPDGHGFLYFGHPHKPESEPTARKVTHRGVARMLRRRYTRGM